MGRKKDVTMQDIADYLSICKVTVSKALNGKDGVGQELKEKIIEVGNRLGYRLPDNVKGASGQAVLMAIFMKEKFAQGEEGFYLRLYQRLSVELSRRGHFAQLFPVSYKDRLEGNAASMLENYDISIVSFDNDIYAELCVPKLTTAEVDIDRMAKKSVELLCVRMGHEPKRPRGVAFVNTAIIYRDSVKKINEKE